MHPAVYKIDGEKRAMRPGILKEEATILAREVIDDVIDGATELGIGCVPLVGIQLDEGTSICRRAVSNECSRPVLRA